MCVISMAVVLSVLSVLSLTSLKNVDIQNVIDNSGVHDIQDVLDENVVRNVHNICDDFVFHDTVFMIIMIYVMSTSVGCPCCRLVRDDFHDCLIVVMLKCTLRPPTNSSGDIPIRMVSPTNFPTTVTFYYCDTSTM
jgi:hypothetical protein